VGVGTGGTISGIGKYLKEKNPKIKIWGIDTYGSVFKKYHETGIFDKNEIYPYITEGIGEDILPANVDFSIIDHFEKVTDKDAANYTRKIAREEGIFVGNSAGSAIKGLLQLKDQLTEDDVVVVLFHDHGSRYIGKIFNDDWMRERGFMEEKRTTASDLISGHKDINLVSVYAEELISHAVTKMRKYNISQIPVMRDDVYVGSLNDSHTYQYLIENPTKINSPISSIMQKPFPIVQEETGIDAISKMINKDTSAVLVELTNGKFNIITKQDIIAAFA
jgi:cystathionine beta-synthase